MSTSPNPLPSAVPRILAPPIDSESPIHGQEIVTSRDKPPISKPGLPKPTLRLHINNVRHPAVLSFLSLVPDLASTLETALAAIIQYLYTPPSPSSTKKHPTPSFTPSIPPTRSVTVLLRDIDGVAYTTGTDLDDDHKEIHLSLSYIATSTAKHPRPAAEAEITGVLTHELVHCYQHTSPRGAASESDSDSDPAPRPPGGLIEGIANFVRLRAGLEPPHWKRPASAKERPDKWDQGYQHTAYFLAWLEDVRVGKGAVGMLNDRLLRVGYVGEDAESDKQGFWKGLFGKSIAELWEEYGEYLDRVRNSGNWEDEIVNLE
ncbi:basic secretory family protein [Aspergillus clavatus NRRL 1]|uniref:PBSP domain protein n=1 Tax=Aspergillus clavatus (strain ATCC 1007 / CBS 513.65 / DSM 816 / NCTC 3887 / NRRL 1 / QM 1276 / 107) TaxID=344612 RepID=A1CPJ0_ASPCL|nr:PBSP domain protein [Aspergillus clavatus NRRL 1]EAW07561.1 PBSP domain protein [Aspergillus clavatus NRRL 1]